MQPDIGPILPKQRHLPGVPTVTFFFIIAMTTLMEDAANLLSPLALEALHTGDLADLRYADHIVS